MIQSCPTRGNAAVAEPAPFISVVVPVRNEARFIRATLRQLLEQDYDPARFEVLVADGESTDGTAEIVREFAGLHNNVHLLSNARRWSSAGRNAGVRAARGELIVVVDGHCELGSTRYLANLADAFARSGADCVGRPQPLDVTGTTTLQRAIAAGRASRLGHNPSSFIYSSAEQFVRPQSVAVAYRREVFDAIGLFDESFDACEDVEFNHRVEQGGFRCFFTPRITVRYHPRATLLGLIRQLMRYGRGRVRLLRKHPETFSLPCFLPAAFLLGVALGPALAWLSPWLAAAYLGVLGLYVLTLLLASMGVARRERDARLIAWLPLVYGAIHLGGGLGVLLELLAGRHRQSIRPELTIHRPSRGTAGWPVFELPERRAG